MKKTLINTTPEDFPRALRPIIFGKIYDSSSSPEARVYFIESAGAYLKRAPLGTLYREAKMDEYFHSLGLSGKVLSYINEGEDWLLTEAVRGEDATAECYLESPGRLAALMGEQLRRLHETDFSTCPITDRMSDYFDLAEKNYRAGIYDLSYSGLSSAEKAWDIVNHGRDSLESRVLLHGDFCLPNIILKDWKLSGYIDLGSGGVGDRHVDLFWGAWTLAYNLKTDKYRDVFFDAYGRELVDEDKLDIIAAAECFG